MTETQAIRVDDVRAELEALADATARDAGRAGLLKPARQLAGRLRAAAPLAAPEEPAVWQGARDRDEASDLVLCWREARAGVEAATLQASWAGGALESLLVTCGEHYWAWRAEVHDDSDFGSDIDWSAPLEETATEPLRKKIEAGIEARLQEDRDAVWRCAHCGFENAQGAGVCSICGAPVRSTAGAGSAGKTAGRALPKEPPEPFRSFAPAPQGTPGAPAELVPPDEITRLLEALATTASQRALRAGRTSAVHAEPQRTCVRCGQPLDAKARYCPACGADQEVAPAKPRELPR